MGEVIEMMFGVVRGMGPRNYVLDEGPYPLQEGEIFGVVHCNI